MKDASERHDGRRPVLPSVREENGPALPDTAAKGARGRGGGPQKRATDLRAVRGAAVDAEALQRRPGQLKIQRNLRESHDESRWDPRRLRNDHSAPHGSSRAPCGLGPGGKARARHRGSRSHRSQAPRPPPALPGTPEPTHVRKAHPTTARASPRKQRSAFRGLSSTQHLTTTFPRQRGKACASPDGISSPLPGTEPPENTAGGPCRRQRKRQLFRGQPRHQHYSRHSSKRTQNMWGKCIESTFFSSCGYCTWYAP